jgi:hypothetical protein
MTEISTFAAEAKLAAGNYKRCDHESALCYAVEGVVEKAHGWKSLSKMELALFVDAVCDAEGIDSPEISHLRRAGNVIASADIEYHSIEFRGSTVNVGSVLHEIAHLTAGAGDHGIAFRNEYLRLVRQHASVEHAAFLHAVMRSVGLSVAPWQALG